MSPTGVGLMDPSDAPVVSTGNRSPWPHQERVLTRCREALAAGERAICVVSATGTGKSEIAFRQVQELSAAGKRVAVYCHRRLLFEQLSKGMYNAGITHGHRAAGHRSMLSRGVQLCMAQTERSRVLKEESRELHDADIVIVDEPHLQANGAMLEILKRHLADGASIIGYTATPTDIGHLYTHLVQGATPSEGRACGALLPARCYGPEMPDKAWIKRVAAGEENLDGKLKKQYVQMIFGRVVEHWARLNPERRPTILFAPGVPESRWFAKAMWHLGIKAAHIDAQGVWADGKWTSGDQKRQEVLERIASGDLEVLCNRFVLREGVNCLDSETEILTSSGWKTIDDPWSPSELVWTLNTATNRAELIPINCKFERMRRPDERMVRITSQHIKLRVTEGHNFVAKYFDPHRGNKGGSKGRLSKNWITLKAIDLTQRSSDYAIPVSCHGEFSGTGLDPDAIRLLGWIVTDGSFGLKCHEPCVFIYQKKLRYIGVIDGILKRMQLRHRKNKRKNGLYVWTIPGNDIWDILGDYLSKCGTDAWDSMTRKEFRLFWNAMCQGDGSRLKRKTQGSDIYHYNNLTVGCKQLADKISAMAVLRGYGCSCCEYNSTTSGSPYWSLRISTKEYLSSRPSDTRSAKYDIEEIFRPERVWCVSNDNATIIVRRKGRISIIGNCPELYHAILATRFGSETTYVQAIGRVLRNHHSLPGHVIVQDHGGSVMAYGSPNEDRIWQLNQTSDEREYIYRRERQEGTQPEPFTCPNCMALRRSGDTCPFCGFTYKKRVRRVLQRDGSLAEYTTPTYRKPRVAPVNLQKLWLSCFWGAHRSGTRTFRQAFAWFSKQAYTKTRQLVKPDPTWPYMPQRLIDEIKCVADVPFDRLNSGE